ncbi:POK9 protein, partial [Mionectes macconnelli]|nr:POK9 protein [Mionectes macconnelli]
RGNLRIDLAEAVDVTLTTTTVHKIPTGIKGPVYDEQSEVGALLIGRSSAGTAGLIVLLGVIDVDFMGEILITAFTLKPPLVITKGTCIAQLVVYTKHTVHNDNSTTRPSRGNRGFRSTGNTVVNLVQKMQQRPMVPLQLTCQMKTCCVHAMMDTGADVTIFS